MALQSAHGTISILSTNTVGTTKVVSGLAFAPQVVFFWWSGNASATDDIAGADYNCGFGFATGPSARRYVGYASDDGVTTTAARGAFHDAACMGINDPAAAGFLGLLDIQTFDSGGFTAIIDDQFPIDIRVHWLAIGGGDITDLSIGTYTIETVDTFQQITAPGFQSDLVLLIRAGRSNAAPPNTASDAVWTIGVVDSVRQWCCSTYTDSGVTTTQTTRHGHSGTATVFHSASGAISFNGTVAITATGFDITWDITPTFAGTGNFYLCIKGGNWRADSLTTRTDGADIVKDGFGFTPVGALFASHGQAENTATDVSDHGMSSVGGAASVSSRGAMAGSDRDAVTTTQSTHAVEYDAVYARIDPTTDAIVGLMDLKSFDSDGLTTVMDDADPDAAWVGFVAVGNTPAGGGDANTWHPVYAGSGGRSWTTVASGMN